MKTRMIPQVLQKNKLFALCCIGFLFFACDAKSVVDTYLPVPDSAWQQNQFFSFPFEITDTVATHELYINLRNNNTYAFSNLFLITALEFPNGQQIIDTLEYQMADSAGKFIGVGFSEMKENKLVYKENTVFPVAGKYLFSVQQAMRKNGNSAGISSLKGITDIGFRVEKTTE